MAKSAGRDSKGRIRKGFRLTKGGSVVRTSGRGRRRRKKGRFC